MLANGGWFIVNQSNLSGNFKSDSPVKGDFHVIRFEGMYHVVFRPDADPEWFRIVASFFTYDRAYMYCDIERVSSYEPYDERGGNSETADEEHGGLRTPPLHLSPPESLLERVDGIPDLVRGVYDGGDHAEPAPLEDFSDHPHDDEPPKEFHDRVHQEAVAAIEREANKPTCAECGGPRSPTSASLCRACYTGAKPAEDGELTPNQNAVLEFFLGHANPLRLVNATFRQIATEARVASGSVVYLVETLERKGFIEIVERGGGKQSSVFKLVPEKIMETAPERD